ncbi:MAG TPA: ADOP family duplicated permease [Vicinamibacterales bacterium]
MDHLLRDVRHAFRSLRRSRSVAVLTVLTLSLGIGAVTALFAVVDAVLLRPIVPAQERVVVVSKLDTRRAAFPVPLSLPEFTAWRDGSRSFEATAAIDHAATGVTTITSEGRVSPVRVAPVSADFFRVIYSGQPLLGRWLRADDERRGAELAAVVSERFWRRATGGDPTFVGRRLSLAGDRSLLVVGIAPAAVDYPIGTDLWAAAAAVFDGAAGRFDASNRTFAQFELLGRMSPGVSADQARAELSVVHRRVAAQFPNDDQSMEVTIEPVVDFVVGNSRRVLLALSGAAALVFIIAGINVAALLLLRASGRKHEVAVRVALGAGRLQLLRQTVIEALVLGTAGAVGGAIMARALIAGVQWLAPGDMPRIEHAAVDLRVLTFCAVAALAWVLGLGTVPAWAHRQITRAAKLDYSFRSIRGTRGLVAFTAAEIAAAVIVAIGAGLLVRTFAHLQAIDRGFKADDLTVVSLLLPESRQRDSQAMLALYRDLLPRVEALPNVSAASPIHVGPGTGTFGLSAPMLFEGQSSADAKTNPFSTWEPVLPSYFKTLGVPVVSGRTFTDGDRRDGAPVAIVSESVARRFWPGQNALGKRLKFVDGSDWPWVTIVGIARDNRYRELTKSWMTVYFPADQFFYFRPASLVVRGSTPPAALAASIQQQLRTIEPAATVDAATPMPALLDRELARPFTALTVIGVFALIAIVLAAVGVYGVTSNEVRERRRELAVRSAIGASPRDILRAVLQRGAIVGAIGAAAGLVVATMATQWLRSLLFEVQPLDPGVFGLVAGALLLIVIAATYLPARVAAATDPTVLLRAE